MAEPHSFDLDGGAPRIGVSMSSTSYGVVVKYGQKSNGPFYGVSIGRPIDSYNGSLPSRDGSLTMRAINDGVARGLDRTTYAIRLDAAQADEGVRFLPWIADKATFMRLRAGETRLFFTGPLQGCNIYVWADGADRYVVHANSNSASGAVANLSAKETLNQVARAQFDEMGAVLVGTLLKSDYEPATPDAYNGFVYGIYANNTWQFYGYSCVWTSGRWNVCYPPRLLI